MLFQVFRHRQFFNVNGHPIQFNCKPKILVDLYSMVIQLFFIFNLYIQLVTHFFEVFFFLHSVLQHRYVVDCQRLTDLMLKSLSNLRNIIVLNLADCVRISDAGVRQLAEGPSGGKIRELNLTNCVRVSDVSLLRISQRY